MIPDGRPWHHVGARLPRNPFDAIPIIPHLEWCRRCQMDVTVEISTGHADGVDVYRKTCRRCGGVMQYGIGRRHLTGDRMAPLPAAALRFIQTTGPDRR